MRLTRTAAITFALGMIVAATTLGPTGASAADQSANDVFTYQVGATGDAGDLASRLVAAGFDVAARDGQTIFVVGDAATQDRLTSFGGLTITAAGPAVAGSGALAAPPDQDAILPRRLDGKTYPTFYGGYRTVKAYLDFTSDLADAYPKLVQSIDYGDAWSGGTLRAVCVTADADQNCQLKPDVDKARFLVVAQTHARELTTSELMWRFLTYLVDSYGRSAEVTGLLKDTEVWIVPQTNPDGIKEVEDGITHDGFGSGSPAWQRKNIDDDYSGTPCSGPWANSQEGIDLNRNFDVDWGRTGTSKDPCSLVYGGPEAASEPEVTAQVDLMKDLFPDQRGGGDDPAPKDATGGMLTLHSYANQVLLPWGYTTEHAPNDTGLRSYAFRMSYFNGFEAGQSGEILYNSSGATEDWLYDQLGIAGFTWEIGPDGGSCAGFFPTYDCQDMFWDVNHQGLMYAAEAAREPYTLTLGPTVLEPKAKDHGSGEVKIVATADDNAYGTTGVGRPQAQDVTKARVFVKGTPWSGGKSVDLKVKGDGSTVQISGVLDASGKSKLAYVQARDADGNWGPAMPIWLPPKS